MFYQYLNVPMKNNHLIHRSLNVLVKLLNLLFLLFFMYLYNNVQSLFIQ